MTSTRPWSRCPRTSRTRCAAPCWPAGTACPSRRASSPRCSRSPAGRWTRACSSRSAPSRSTGALHEASVAGVVQQDRSGLVWFRHPLLSDVLYSTLLPDQARDLHGAFVDVLTIRRARGALRSHGDLALHFAGAERYDESFEHCLLAAEEASAAMAYPEAAVLLRHACELWPDVSPRVRERSGPLPALLAESARIARLTGDLRGALAQLDAALPLLDEAADPLTAARVVRLRSQVAYTTGSATAQAVPDMRRAVEISAAVPDSDEHALALADLSDAELWTGDRDGGAAARARGRRRRGPLRRRGGPVLRARVRWPTPGWTRRAPRHRPGRRSGWRTRPGGWSTSASPRSRWPTCSTAPAGSPRPRRCSPRRTRPGSASPGSPACSAPTPRPRWCRSAGFTEARDILRDVLSSRPGGIIGIQARETAVVVAIRTGDLDEAAMHLERLRELADNFEEYAGLHGPGVQAEYLLATGRPNEALAAAGADVEAHANTEPKYGDTLLLWAARAASALPPRCVGRGARRRGRRPGRAARSRPSRAATGTRDSVRSRRCSRPRWRAASASTTRWAAGATAVPLVDAAGLRFAAADARLRLAEALLAVRDRREAATAAA